MWARVVSGLIGVWLMAAPGVLDYGSYARVSDHIAGPLAVAIAVIAHSEVTRPVRWLAVPLGLWLALSAWPLGGGAPAVLSNAASGLALIVLAWVRGRVEQRYGGGWSALWSRPRSTDQHTKERV